ncbi:MAG: radical SAM family heme chaperone HemW [Actinomycetaceae bacterium]|nr:radical SAM family heme chaperone HemW [Actinomycetaceae bacterium]
MTRGFSVYIHVPFCAVRCGYCDFNTYTVGFGRGAEPTTYAVSVERELTQARERGLLREAQSVYLGGGTPSLLPDDEIAALLMAVRRLGGIAEGAEVSLEANPDTVTPARTAAWSKAGITRVSMGMQSAVPHVLATLERTHSPLAVPRAVEAVKAAGMDVSVDLIYGTPRESLSDWEASLKAAIALEPDHVSAYGLVVEKGTKMGRLVARGELPAPSSDDEAEKYMLADELLARAGYAWYEISNWARRGPAEDRVGDATKLAHASRHNLAYWSDDEWWGAGPGAHSFVRGRRWWNVKHPGVYAASLAAGRPVEDDGEVPTADERRLEHVMVAIRLARGLSLSDASEDGNRDGVVAGLLRDGLACVFRPQPDGTWEPVEGPVEERLSSDRLVLTLKGRLLADEVTRRLVFS